MANTFHVNIATPDRICIDKECISVNMPSTKGYLTFLPHHAHIIGALEPGFLTITYEDGSQYRALINNGVFQFKDNTLVVLSDFCEQDNKVSVDALTAIKARITETMKQEELFERTSRSLNSFTKLVTAKASSRGKK